MPPAADPGAPAGADRATAGATATDRSTAAARATGADHATGDRGVVLVVGDVIDDLVVRPLGPVAHGTDTPARIDATLGGSGANQAVWLAAAGATVRFAGRVGHADLSRHTAALRSAGVEPHLVGDATRATGRIVLLIGTDGERTMFTDRGANLGLRAADLPDDLLDGASVLHLSGYALFDADVRTAVLDLLGRARRRGLAVSVDPGSAGFLADVGPAAFLAWLGDVDLLLPNLDEGRLLTGREAPDEVATALLDHAAVVALTLGPHGALVTSRAARGEPPRHVPATDVEVVDTTGAGDAFTGAFLAAWLAGADPSDACHLGVVAGGRATTLPGGRPAGTATG